MKSLLSLAVMTAALVLPFASHADEFDITMDVVAADESFDEVIVNRIALPFTAAGERQAFSADQADASLASEAIDGMADVVDQPVDDSGMSDGLDAGSLVQDQGLPMPADLNLGQ